MDRIDICMNCTRPECTNCLSRRATGRNGRPTKYDPVRMERHMQRGLNLRQIAEIEEVSLRTVIRWEKKLFRESGCRQEREV